ncbi:hypothetical protein M9H77_08871 [Catharanthus roseus]|uniref:Uncharacterized protein n=1 Tax=Catharanthus roseus TaxID=4058 RepID=A0ACC0BZE1_CATRO|nr:hypothetical protein M9H77_08871 [Catharanthus roseus]
MSEKLGDSSKVLYVQCCLMILVSRCQPPQRPQSRRDNGRRILPKGISLSSVASPDSPPVPFPFNNAFPGFMYQFIQNWKNVVEIRRRMSYDLRHHMNVYGQLFSSVERVTVDNEDKFRPDGQK